MKELKMPPAPTTREKPASNGGSRVRDLSSRGFKSRKVIPQVEAGGLLVALFAIGSLLWHFSSGNRTAAVAAARDIARGEVLAREDLRTVGVNSGGEVPVLDPEQIESLVGNVAAVDMSTGTLVNTRDVADAGMFRPGDGLVGLALAAGQYPASDLAIGDVVNVHATGSPTPLVWNAQVAAIEGMADGDHKLVSLQATAADAGVIAAAQADAVRLVRVKQ